MIGNPNPNPLAAAGGEYLPYGPLVAVTHKSKRPCHKWKGDDALTEIVDFGPYLSTAHNLAIRLDNFFVIDVDGPNGAKSFEKLKAVIPGLPSDVLQRSGGDGFHVFFRMSEPLKKKVPTKHPLYPNIDFKHGAGHILVMAPSIHPSGRPYLIEGDLGEAPALPNELVDHLSHPGANTPACTAAEGGTVGERHTLLLRRGIELHSQGWDFKSIGEALWNRVSSFKNPWTEDEAGTEIRGVLEWLGKLSDGRLFPASPAALDIAKWLAPKLRGDVVHLDNGAWLVKHDNVFRYAQAAQVKTRLVRTLAPALDDYERWLAGISDEKAQLAAQKKLLRLKSLSWTDKTLEALGAHGDLSKNTADLDPAGVLNFTNGPYTIEGERADWAVCTKQLGVAYSPSALEAPTFERFLHESLSDETAQTFLDLAGHALLRSRNSQSMWIVEGPPASGKSTLVDLIAELFGTYAVAPDTGLLFDTSKFGSGGPNEDLFALNGAAWAVFPEGPSGCALNPSRCKTLTGGDKLSARPLYGHLTQFENKAELLLVTNHETRLNVEDGGLRRRVKRVLFKRPVPPERRDHHLNNKLVAEGAAILNLLLRHAQAVREHGIRVSQEVVADTADMLTNQDILQTFIDECLLILPTAQSKGTELYDSYRNWCVMQGIPPRTAHRFYKSIEQKEPKIEPYTLNGSKAYRGVALRGKNVI
ncbi:phage/plasmid primase, P4 family [Maricaulis maris]|uniref:phage/plasmid primase, P4 family n=1 Tax=Maricaulis maris TaxID=74318 RepID=UPI003A90A403